jgi:spore coat polysaccharide biosynthesis predicted glycosyltransferase SpsG
MNIFIRAYGSHLMGMGHLYRIKKIITKLRTIKNDNIILLTRKYEEAINIYSTLDVDNILELDKNISIDGEIEYLNNYFKQNRFDICINDQLNTPIGIAKELTKNIHNNITFDDCGDGSSLFNSIINVLYPSNKNLPNEINSYNYMILDDYSEIKRNITFKEDVKKIFINQGAADTWGAIPDMINDFNKVSSNVILKVLLGPSFNHYNELSVALKNSNKQIEIYNFTDSVLELVKDCDLAILGAGNTLFEVASLGIPIIASTREEKELITINRLLKDNIVFAENRLYSSGLEHIVNKVISDKKERENKFNLSRKLFTYSGLDKIIDLILGEKR